MDIQVELSVLWFHLKALGDIALGVLNPVAPFEQFQGGTKSKRLKFIVQIVVYIITYVYFSKTVILRIMGFSIQQKNLKGTHALFTF